MHCKLNSNLFTPEHMKCFEVNSVSQKAFANGIEHVRKSLNALERSLCKTAKYEDQLLRCKATHAHSHDWSESDSLETGRSISAKPSRGPVDIADSWSTMSIVCLQYQYEELSKKYTSLLHAYHESCNAVRSRDASLARLRAHTQLALAQQAHTHRTLIAVGEKFLRLYRRKQVQKSKYEARIRKLEATVHDATDMCELARLQLDSKITRLMQEWDAPNAQLLAEIRKCNLVFLEYLRLKAQIEAKVNAGGNIY